jgi:hypothetical protein
MIPYIRCYFYLFGCKMVESTINKEDKRKKEVKRSKKVPYGMDFYLYVICYIKKHNKLPEMGISKQAMQYHLKKLKVSNIINKIGYGTWAVDQDKWEQFQARKEVKIMPKVGKPTEIEKLIKDKPIRGHGFVFTLKIPNIRNWDNREQYLIKHKIDYKNIGLHNSTQSINFRNHKIWLSNRSIIIYFPKDKSYFDNTAEDSKKFAIYHFKHLIIGLERLLGTNFRINNNYEFKVSRQHYANINNSLAKQYNMDGSKLNVYNAGKLWFIIDNSFNLNEAETVKPDTASKDMDKVVMPFFNDLKDHYDNTGESLTISKMMQVVNGLLELETKRELNKYTDNVYNHDNYDKKKPDYLG